VDGFELLDHSRETADMVLMEAQRLLGADEPVSSILGEALALGFEPEGAELPLLHEPGIATRGTLRAADDRVVLRPERHRVQRDENILEPTLPGDEASDHGHGQQGCRRAQGTLAGATARLGQEALGATLLDELEDKAVGAQALGQTFPARRLPWHEAGAKPGHLSRESGQDPGPAGAQRHLVQLREGRPQIVIGDDEGEVPPMLDERDARGLERLLQNLINGCVPSPHQGHPRRSQGPHSAGGIHSKSIPILSLRGRDSRSRLDEVTLLCQAFQRVIHLRGCITRLQRRNDIIL
jgi:hypothetical protein